jgi:acyl-CoA synthetase (AMP-forming)/AMP-acid ligase II
MDLGLVLEMATSAVGDRVLVQDGDRRLGAAELDRLATAAAERFRAAGADAVVYVGTNGTAYAVCLFGAARAAIPLVPLNYRASSEQLAQLLAAHPGAIVVSGGIPDLQLPVASVDRDELLAELAAAEPGYALPGDPDAPAVLLYTSGTTAAPKAAVLRHRHLTAYLMTAVEFGTAAEDDAALVTVPPYHVAGLTNLLSNVWSGRRLVYLESFTPAGWLETVRREGVTQAMVVPTMLAKVVEHLGDAADADVPTLRTLSYGGSRMPLPVLERALALFPGTGFVNAYGLTETSSTIALLGPEDHRAAFASDDPAVRGRLTSVGQPVPGLDVEVRDPLGNVLPAGEKGLVFLRGEQVSGEYATGSTLDELGWFPTRDSGWLDADGYLYIEGRADDTIIRGGENIAPAEVEDALCAHPSVSDVVVVGVPDDTWGQRIEAVVVATAPVEEEELRSFVRDRLRSSKTPDRIRFRTELPRTDTGKLLRRVVLAEIAAADPKETDATTPPVLAGS